MSEILPENLPDFYIPISLKIWGVGKFFILSEGKPPESPWCNTHNCAPINLEINSQQSLLETWAP